MGVFFKYYFMERVLISGGTGLVGKKLALILHEKGYLVSILSRDINTESMFKHYIWDYKKGVLDKKAISSTDYIIHLAGSGVADSRWTDARKKDILESRTLTADLLFKYVKDCNPSLKGFISASAVGYYGMINTERTFTEEDAPASDFLGDVCKLWEASADQFNDVGIRTLKLRIGVVLAEDGGALAKMKQPFLYGIGSSLGDGQQYMPWIHVDDLCNMFLHVLENKTLSGSYNAVAPEHITNAEFSKLLAKVLKKPFWAPNVPAFILRMLLGTMSDVLLKGSKVSSAKIASTGFSFKFPSIEKSLIDLTTIK